MKAIITRADDCGSSQAANEAIYEAVQSGFIKNVSIMACGAHLKDAAERMASDTSVCFGLHGCINAEWDKVAWGSVAPKERVASLLKDGNRFYPSVRELLAGKPVIDEIITEYRYQLERVRKFGFDVKYMDSHMFPEWEIPGLEEAMERMMEKEKLINHNWFQRFLPGGDRMIENEDLFEYELSGMEGQYVFFLHPAKYGAEMCMTGNAEVSGETVAKRREADYRFAINPKQLELCKRYGVRLIRYDEAEVLGTAFDKRAELDRFVTIPKGYERWHSGGKEVNT